MAEIPTRVLETGIAVRCENLRKTYGTGEASVVALRDVSVAFRRGEFTAIMGPSGSGKSTLMQCMAGLDSATSGTVLFGDVEMTGLDDDALTRLRRERMGFVFQSFNLLPAFTARQNIHMPMKLAGRRVGRDWFDQLVATLGIEDRLSHRPAELSGGQQQRVAIARALINQPDVVFCDEPTGALDSTSSQGVLDFLRGSVDDLDSTIIMVTHDATAAAYADRVIYLTDGEIAGELRDPGVDQILNAIRQLGAA